VRPASIAHCLGETVMVFLGEPPATAYDLRFSVLGFPTRVHPLFWLIALIMGLGGSSEPRAMVIWVAVVFVSILIHELGHAVLFRLCGFGARIVLYTFGGLAIPEGRTHGGGPLSLLPGWGQHALISFAGPAAGFLLAGGILAALQLSGHAVELRFQLPYLVDWDFQPLRSMPATHAIHQLLFVNIFWGLVNLVPVFPLDGGQIAQAILTRANPRQGVSQSLQLSMLCGVGMAVLAIVRFHSPYMAILFGVLAFQSFQALQGGAGRSSW
jgi:stage IV sporulation protein FB